ncbi:MAG: hypothetical protein ABIK09_11590, partial [Pseudomonadota bacterium]
LQGDRFIYVINTQYSGLLQCSESFLNGSSGSVVGWPKGGDGIISAHHRADRVWDVAEEAVR